MGFGADGGETLPASGLAGRAALGEIEAGPERWIVRRFHHGGILRGLGESLFLRPARPFHELVLSCELRSAGLPTPRVIAARAVRSGPLGWRLALVSARVEGAQDGQAILASLRRGDLTPAERRAFLAAAGELVGRMHAERFWHADLTPNNLLFGPAHSVWVLDLDGGHFVRELGNEKRRDNLRRLFRAVQKRARGPGLARPFLTRADHLRFLTAYRRSVGAGDWREDWRAIVRGDRRAAPVHRFGWWLEERFGARRAWR